jgi:hypothetical protein
MTKCSRSSGCHFAGPLSRACESRPEVLARGATVVAAAQINTHRHGEGILALLCISVYSSGPSWVAGLPRGAAVGLGCGGDEGKAPPWRLLKS